MNSPIFKLHLNDFEKGLLVALFSPLLLQVAAICNAIVTGTTVSAIDWSLLLKVSVASGTGYLVKNLITNSQGQVLSPEPPKV